MNDPRTSADQITDVELAQLYDDREIADRVIADLNKTITDLTWRLTRARAMHETNCVVARKMVASGFTCSMCHLLADPKEKTP